MINLNKINFSDLILSVRARLNVTQQKLADLLGVTLLTVSRWERGVCSPAKKDKLRLIYFCKENGVEIQEDKDD